MLLNATFLDQDWEADYENGIIFIIFANFWHLLLRFKKNASKIFIIYHLFTQKWRTDSCGNTLVLLKKRMLAISDLLKPLSNCRFWPEKSHVPKLKPQNREIHHNQHDWYIQKEPLCKLYARTVFKPSFVDTWKMVFDH